MSNETMTDNTEALRDSNGRVIRWIDPIESYVAITAGIAHHDDAGGLRLFHRVTKREVQETLGGERVLRSARDVLNASTVRRVRVPGGGEYFEHVLPRYAEQNADLFAGPIDRVIESRSLDRSWLKDRTRWLIPFAGETLWVRPIEQLSAFLNTHGADNVAVVPPLRNGKCTAAMRRVIEESDAELERLSRREHTRMAKWVVPTHEDAQDAEPPKRGRPHGNVKRTRLHAMPGRFWTDFHGRRIPNFAALIFELEQHFGIGAETVRDLVLYDYRPNSSFEVHHPYTGGQATGE